MSFREKLWVHVRFFIKFVPIQLIALSLSMYGAILAVVAVLLFGYSNIFLDWFLISLFATPFAIIFRNDIVVLRLSGGVYSIPVLKSLFWIWRDDSMYNGDSRYLLAIDYKHWLNMNGGKETFWTFIKWYTRNRCYNFQRLFRKPPGREFLIQQLQNTLVLNGQPVDLSDDYGEMPYDYFAGLKWITKEGKEDWWTYTGVKISEQYSIFGTMELYYRIGSALYYKYSKCVMLENKWWKLFFRVALLFTFKNTFKKDLWFTFKYHANNEGGTIHMKIQWEKE